METNQKQRSIFAKVYSRFSLRGLIFFVAATGFFCFSMLPVVYMAVSSFVSEQGAFSIENYKELLSFDARRRSLLLNSAALGFGAACLSTLIGVPLGFLLARAEYTFKRLWRFVLVVPLVIPPYIFALAWVLMLGRPAPEIAYSLFGAIIVLGLCFYPLPMLAAEAALRQVDRRTEEAALLAASPFRVFRRITMPLIAPVVSAVFLIVFVLSVAEFGVPGLLRVRVFTTEVFTAFAALYDFGAATALAVPASFITLVAAIFAAKLLGEKTLIGRRKHLAAANSTRGAFRFALLAGAGVVLVAAVVLPILTLSSEAFAARSLSKVVLDSGAAIANSLLLSAIGAGLVVIISVILGYSRSRAKTNWRWFADVVFLVIFAVPSTVVGVGIIALWNRGGLEAIYTSQAIIVVGYLARFTPVAALIFGGIVRQIPYSIEEAAAISGANWLRVFGRIVLPSMKNGIAGVWLIIFILTFGELGTTLLVAPPGETTLPVRIYTLIANTPPSEVAALALLQIAVILFPLAFLILWRKPKKKTA
ncbi:MAG TPA: iron ABC transporter permease [Pyrinomonadaceae bacterium]|nr:iron ABC transporter permease [Pyrinomonadaceae bacterium]